MSEPSVGNRLRAKRPMAKQHRVRCYDRQTSGVPKTAEHEAGVKKRVGTTKDIGLLKQLHDLGQLTLAPEFQRDSVWPKAAKAYLMDTILNDLPIPHLFFQRVQSTQTGKPQYAVIDGQQRLRAIFEFLDDRYRLTETNDPALHGKLHSQISPTYQEVISNYALDVQELSGYGDEDIRDIFARMNKYVVKLSAQEMRHAREGQGKFARFAERVGRLKFWLDRRVISAQQHKRMRNVEFVAELAILLIEGAQDKKASVDLYYGRYKDDFPKAAEIESLIKGYLSWVEKAIPQLSQSRFRSPTDFYSLIGALHAVSMEGTKLSALDPAHARENLRAFEAQTREPNAKDDAARYLAAASRQTDNIQPRNTRIEIMTRILRKD